MDSNYVMLTRYLRVCGWEWKATEGDTVTEFTRCLADDLRGGEKEEGGIKISANVNGDAKFLFATTNAIWRKCDVKPVLRFVTPVNDPTKIVAPYLDYSNTLLFYPIYLVGGMLNVFEINLDLYQQVIPSEYVWHLPFYFAIEILFKTRKVSKEEAIAETVTRYGEVFTNYTRSLNIRTSNVPGYYTLENYTKFNKEISKKTEEWLGKWVDGFISRAPENIR